MDEKPLIEETDEQQPGNDDLTPEELASMTEEERRAFEDEGEEKSDEDEAAKEEGGDEPSEDSGEGEKEEQEEVDDAPTKDHFVPVLKTEPAEDLQTKFDALDKQLEEGDIDIIQYNKQLRPLIQAQVEPVGGENRT